jgi:hypothetical protein
MSENSSWLHGLCKKCNYPIVVTQPHFEKFSADYQWYCSNRLCENHIYGEHTYDNELPTFILSIKESISTENVSDNISLVEKEYHSIIRQQIDIELENNHEINDLTNVWYIPKSNIKMETIEQLIHGFDHKGFRIYLVGDTAKNYILSARISKNMQPTHAKIHRIN